MNLAILAPGPLALGSIKHVHLQINERHDTVDYAYMGQDQRSGNFQLRLKTQIEIAQAFKIHNPDKRHNAPQNINCA
mgnify:CR=1 FL=1|jgi:hypothetical protein